MIGNQLCKKNDEWSFKVRLTEMPNMKNINDSYWDSVREIYINNEKVEIYADTTWGAYGFFEFKENWYKISTDDWEDIRNKEEYHLIWN